MDYFAGRTVEQVRFRDMLAQLSAKDITGPDEGFMVLVHGHGGLGKTSLLRRYREIAAGEESPDRGNRDRFVVEAVDWEHEGRLQQADFAAFAGPPIWKVLDRLYTAVSDDALLWPRARRVAQRAFGPFRLQMTRLPELVERARQLGLDSVVGRQRLTAAELAQIVDAAARVGASFAGHPGAGSAAVSGGAAPGLGVIAAAAAEKAQVYWRGAVDPDAFASLTSDVDALVRAFATGLRSFSRKVRPVVLVLDTCELLGNASDWLLEVIRLAGARTAWVLGVRLAPRGEVSLEGALARLHTTAHRDRMISLPLSPFDDQTIVDYLHDGSGKPLPDGVTVAEVVRVTRGIPLAVSFVAASLRQGRSPEELFGSSPAGPSAQVVRGLAQRYLTHIRSSPELAADLPLVYGLALLADDRVDARLLGALWDVPAAEVSDRLDRLAQRHDFVLGASRRLHKDVGDAIRDYLLDPVERETVRPMNERAVAHLRSRLAGEYPKDLEGQLSDELWQRDVTGLLWHTCWLNPREGYRQLCQVFPAAAVLEPAFALNLTQAARYFTGHYPSADQVALDGLYLLAARPYLPPLASSDITAQDSPAAAMSALSATSMAEPILGAGVGPQVFVDMLATMHGDLIGTSMNKRLTCLERAADHVPADTGKTPLAVAALARRMAIWTGWTYAESESPIDDQAVLRASRIAVALNPDDALSHSVLGTILARLGALEEAEKELREACRIDPAKGSVLGMVLRVAGRYDESVAVLYDAAPHHQDDPVLHRDLGMSLLASGNTGEAVAELRRAVRFDPSDSVTHYLLGQALAQTGRFSSAEASLRRSLDIKRDATVLALLGAVVGSSGRLSEAEEMCREAVGLDPDNAEAHFHLGTVLGMTGRHADAEAEFRRAVHLNPRLSEAHYNLGCALTAQSRHSEAKAAFREADRLDTSKKTAQGPQSQNPGNIRPSAESTTSTAYRAAPRQDPKVGVSFPPQHGHLA
jgi:Flp pilus assembly protein TadD